MTQEQYKRVQQFLTDNGYSLGEIDGLWGAKSKTALYQWQNRNELTADGIPGPATWKKMFGEELPAAPVSSMSAKQERFLAEIGALLVIVLGRRYPDLLEKIAKINEYPELAEGYHMMAGEMLRTDAQQAIYVQQGLSKTYDSRHLKRLAADLYIISGGQIIANPKWMGDIWESFAEDNQWGGNWKSIFDPNHFEKEPPK
jgi:hypothetical protein